MLFQQTCPSIHSCQTFLQNKLSTNKSYALFYSDLSGK
jgi:hypothetical protein